MSKFQSKGLPEILGLVREKQRLYRDIRIYVQSKLDIHVNKRHIMHA